MQPELGSDIIATRVATHLTTHDDHRRLLRSTAPLTRAVDIRPASWEHWLTLGGREGTASYVGPLDPHRIAAAKAATRGLAESEGRIVIDRAHLLALSAKAARGNEKACVALWVATMMWGSGFANGRGPWRTAGGLATEELGDVLVSSHKALRSGDLTQAYVEASAIFGSGSGYFTRWLWAASLGLPDADVPPVILDARRRDAFMTVLDTAGYWSCIIGNGRRDYVDYATTLARAAAELRDGHGIRGATAEKIEWLLAEGTIAEADRLAFEAQR